jgi:putative Holliday junction resolvase
VSLVNKPPLLCIDHGVKRLGIAVSDRAWLTARELAVIKRTTREDDFRKLRALYDQQKAAAVVIGIPSHEFEGTGVHTQADTVRLWVERFVEATGLDVVLWDEQLSSHDAKALATRLRRKTTAPIDDLAARVILQSYLDALRDGLAPAPPLPAQD